MHILIDLDNVLLNTLERRESGTFFYWTQNLKKDLGIEPKTLGQLFKGDFFYKTVAEVRECVRRYLAEIGADVSADAFLDYWLKHDSNLNQDVWNWIWNQYQRGKHKFYIASDQSEIRMAYLLRKFPMWAEVFQKMFTSFSLGVCKNNPAFFQKVLSEIKAEVGEICLIDDNSENVAVADSCGIQTVLFSDVADLRKIE